MDIIKDIIYVNKEAGKKSINSIKKNWIIGFTGILYTIINVVLFRILGMLFQGPLYILSGLAIAIVSSGLISNYLYLLHNIINYNRININDFKNGFGYFLWKIYGVLFIGWIASYLFSTVNNIMGASSYLISFIINIIIVILLNPLPETIYLKTYTAWESIVYTFEFIKENWLNWILPNILFLGILYLLTGNILINLFNTHVVFNIRGDILGLILYIIGQGLFSFVMIYRGHLYRILSTSTRRKRMFMNKF